MTGPQAAGLGTLLGVWAHPGDETFLSGGLMALARAAGNRVVVVTATRGELGTADPSRWPAQRLARLRADELAASLAVLGVTEHRWLGFEDGCCPDAPADPAVERLTALIDDLRPDTVITFGPDGVTGDRDHRAVSAWTTAACAGSAARPALLYAHPGDTAAAAGLRLALDDAVSARKAAALRAHASQVVGLHPDPGRPHVGTRWRTELFLPAGTDPAESRPSDPERSVDGIVPRPCSCLAGS